MIRTTILSSLTINNQRENINGSHISFCRHFLSEFKVRSLQFILYISFIDHKIFFIYIYKNTYNVLAHYYYSLVYFIKLLYCIQPC